MTLTSHVGTGAIIAAVVFAFAGMFTGSVDLSIVAFAFLTVHWVAFRLPPFQWIEARIE